MTRSPQSRPGDEWATKQTAGRKSVLLTWWTPWGDSAVNSCSKGTREWKRCLCSYCCNVSLRLTSVVTDWHFPPSIPLSPVGSKQDNLRCCVWEMEVQATESAKKKRLKFSILPFLFGMPIKIRRNSSIRFWTWDIRTIFVLRKKAIHFDKNKLLESQKMGPLKVCQVKD